MGKKINPNERRNTGQAGKKKKTLKDGICKPTIIIIILNVNRIISKLKKD